MNIADRYNEGFAWGNSHYGVFPDGSLFACKAQNLGARSKHTLVETPLMLDAAKKYADWPCRGDGVSVTITCTSKEDAVQVMLEMMRRELLRFAGQATSLDIDMKTFFTELADLMPAKREPDVAAGPS